MNALLLAIAATTLSLSSTNDYHFTQPQHTNLCGKTYLLTGGVVPRYEDIAFLSEALTERQKAIRTRGVAKVDTVPDSLLLGAGRFGANWETKAWLAPSYGYWRGYDAYQFAYYVKPGISIYAPDFRECDERYLWDGVSTADTNAVRAFVADSAFCLPTNAFPVADLSGPLRLDTIKSAYAFLTNDVRVFEYRVDEGYQFYSLADNYVRHLTNGYVHVKKYQYTDYTYPRYDGRTVRSSYISGFTLDDPTGVDQDVTNRGPLTYSFYLNSKARTAERCIGHRITYESASGKEYEMFQVGEPWESYYQSFKLTSNSGNLQISSRALDADMTNVVEEAKCFCVCWWRFVRREEWEHSYGRADLPSDKRYTNCFVTVNVGTVNLTPILIVSGSETNHIYDSGVNLINVARDLSTGYGFSDWVDALRTPELDYPIENIPPSVRSYVNAFRNCEAKPVSVKPYIYLKRKWHARLPEYDQ